MKRSVAVIGTRDSTRRVNELTAALQARGIDPLLCDECDSRATLRWIMDLSSAQVGAAVFVDSDGRLTASHAAALDPAIAAVAWAPQVREGSYFAVVVMDSPVLVSFARDADALLQIISPWIGTADQVSTESTAANKPDNFEKTVTPADNGTAISSHDTAPQNNNVSVVSPLFDERDKATLKELEKQMASAVKPRPRPEPVQVQQPGLDFSLALRGLMTAGRKLAYKNSHPEVLGAHYLIALEEPWRSALAASGLTVGMALDYLSGLDTAEKVTTEPVISEEVFEAVARAKMQARDNQRSCVRIYDFLNGLIRDTSGSIADLLKQLNLTTEDLLPVIAAADTGTEPCSEPFFKPSSMDQAGFYEFDASEVRNLTERLRELPAFQKAAERVAESKSRQGPGAFDAMGEEARSGVSFQPLNKHPSPPLSPPDQPAIMRVNGEFPPVDVIESVADLLLDGQIVAFPTDVMFAIAVDAANRLAVDNLRETAGFAPDRPLSVLIHSTSQLKHLVRDDLDPLEPLLEEFWPGPLTLIFSASSGAARHLSGANKIAVRLPADNVSLAILSMLGRPLAVTSWDQEKSALAGNAAAIVEAEPGPADIRTTVVDLSTRPWQVIREGAVPGQAVLRHYQQRQ